MIIIVLSSLLTLFFILSIILLIRGIAFVKRSEAMQNMIVEYQDREEQTEQVLEDLLKQMREIDLRGSFESDDEVGVVFTQLKDLIESYTKDNE
jgi:predicted Holliday junction resolvase-like endonuclease